MYFHILYVLLTSLTYTLLQDAKRGTDLEIVIARKNPISPKPLELELWVSNQVIYFLNVICYTMFTSIIRYVFIIL